MVTRVENVPLQIQIKFEKDSISCGLRLPKEVILDVEKVGITLHGKYSWLGETSIASKHIKAVRKVVSK